MNVHYIRAHIDGMGAFVQDSDKNIIAEAVVFLSEMDKPETVEVLLLQASSIGASVGYLEAKWRGIQRRAKAQLVACKAAIARSVRETGIKRTENAIAEIVDADPNSQSNEMTLIAAEEVADICQTLRFAVKNRIEGLLELSRTERQERRTS